MIFLHRYKNFISSKKQLIVIAHLMLHLFSICKGHTSYFPPLGKLSFSVTVRLKTSFSAVESLSTAKYPELQIEMGTKC